MYSRLDPLFKSTFHRTESTNTRLGIRHEEKDENRRKKHDSEDEGTESSLWEDSTIVSISALKAFLDGLVKGPQPQQNITPQENIKTPSAKKPSSPAAAKAAKAYESTSRAVHHEQQKPPEVRETTKGENAPTLTPQELRTIHQLIADLNELAATRHIEELTLSRDSSFLQSLVNAVKKIKQS